MRDDFPKHVVETLAKRVGNRCSNPGCRKRTSGPHTEDDKALNIGLAGHDTTARSRPKNGRESATASGSVSPAQSSWTTTKRGTRKKRFSAGNRTPSRRLCVRSSPQPEHRASCSIRAASHCSLPLTSAPTKSLTWFIVSDTDAPLSQAGLGRIQSA